MSLTHTQKKTLGKKEENKTRTAEEMLEDFEKMLDEHEYIFYDANEEEAA